MKKLLACAALATVALFASAANAATFNFSFENVEGAVPGTVSGFIELANGDGTFAATSVTVTDAPELGYRLPLDFTVAANGFTSLYTNSFTVAGGQLTEYEFVAVNDTEGLAMIKSGVDVNFSFLNASGSADVFSGVLDMNGTTQVTALSAVPLPAGFPLLLAGLGVFGFMKSRTRFV